MNFCEFSNNKIIVEETHRTNGILQKLQKPKRWFFDGFLLEEKPGKPFFREFPQIWAFSNNFL